MTELNTNEMKARLEADLKQTLQSIETLRQRALKLQGALEVLNALQAQQAAPSEEAPVVEEVKAESSEEQKVEG
jgi:hypothetical protein